MQERAHLHRLRTIVKVGNVRVGILGNVVRGLKVSVNVERKRCQLVFTIVIIQIALAMVARRIIVEASTILRQRKFELFPTDLLGK